ncbi:MAG TPA: hypothetical protein VJ850_08385 [Candidatus Limnocylindrales bacterium]|nr:hypothetical protein [Candidatus Limnocylindrales bacterium]
MPLRPEDIDPGAVAYFEVAFLNSDPLVTGPAHPTNRNGPFVCYDHVNGQSAWSAITSQERPERLYLEPQWRQGGSNAWRNGAQYLNDGATTYAGPDASFIAAAINEAPMNPRPTLSADGVAAVIVAVRARGGTIL